MLSFPDGAPQVPILPSDLICNRFVAASVCICQNIEADDIILKAFISICVFKSRILAV